MSNKDPLEVFSSTNEGKPKGGALGILGTVALIALIISAVGSLIYMYHQGQDTPRFLLVLFTIWVLAPFGFLYWAIRASKRWRIVTRWTLYCITLIVALSSLAIYGEWIDIKPAGSANAFLWVIVPPASLVFITVIVGVVALLSARLSRRSGGN